MEEKRHITRSVVAKMAAGNNELATRFPLGDCNNKLIASKTSKAQVPVKRQVPKNVDKKVAVNNGIATRLPLGDCTNKPVASKSSKTKPPAKRQPAKKTNEVVDNGKFENGDDFINLTVPEEDEIQVQSGVATRRKRYNMILNSVKRKSNSKCNKITLRSSRRKQPSPQLVELTSTAKAKRQAEKVGNAFNHLQVPQHPLTSTPSSDSTIDMMQEKKGVADCSPIQKDPSDDHVVLLGPTAQLHTRRNNAKKASVKVPSIVVASVEVHQSPPTSKPASSNRQGTRVTFGEPPCKKVNANENLHHHQQINELKSKIAEREGEIESLKSSQFDKIAELKRVIAEKNSELRQLEQQQQKGGAKNQRGEGKKQPTVEKAKPAAGEEEKELEDSPKPTVVNYYACKYKYKTKFLVAKMPRSGSKH